MAFNTCGSSSTVTITGFAKIRHSIPSTEVRLAGCWTTLSPIPLSPFLASKGENIISEGHPPTPGPSSGSGQAPGLRPSAHLINHQPDSVASNRASKRAESRPGPVRSRASTRSSRRPSQLARCVLHIHLAESLILEQRGHLSNGGAGRGQHLFRSPLALHVR